MNNYLRRGVILVCVVLLGMHLEMYADDNSNEFQNKEGQVEVTGTVDDSGGFATLWGWWPGTPSIVDAIDAGNLERVKAMVQKDPKILKKSCTSGLTPLTYAIRINQLDIARYLISQNANVNSVDGNYRQTPLFEVCNLKSRDAEDLANGLSLMVQLIDAGASVNQEDVYVLRKCMSKSIDGKNFEGVKTLVGMSKESVSVLYKDEVSVLMAAIQLRLWDIAVFLIDQGADVNYANSQGWTALHEVCKLDDGSLDNLNNRLSLMRKLINKGARGTSGQLAALKLCVLNCNIEGVKLFAELGADVINYVDGSNKTALTEARELLFKDSRLSKGKLDDNLNCHLMQKRLEIFMILTEAGAVEK